MLGIYDVWPSALDGFAKASDGTKVPLSKRTGFSAAHPEQVSWPDESRHDIALAKLRKRLVGHLVYGYDRIAISCRPDWTKFYAASTPVRVRSIERERGQVRWIGTGSAASAPYVMGTGFIAFDPLSIIVDEPDPARYPPLGTNHVVGGSTKKCPAIELADWQVDTTLSLQRPPANIGALPSPLRVGMARDAIVWMLGYPNEVGTLETLRAESTWHYGQGLSQYTVTFKHDKVASFTAPGTL